MYKRLQVARQSQLLTSPDPCVRFMAEKALQRDLSLQRPKFKPSVMAREVMESDPNYSRKSLSNGANLLVEEEANEARRDHLLSLEKDLNSALDTLPHNANLNLWRKRGDDSCPLCNERQTLIHVLNACPVALHARRYNYRHDVLL